MMKYDIFTSEKEKAEARQALTDITSHPGWKFIDRALELNVKHLTEQLREKKDFKSLQEVYAFQDRIDDLEAFQVLPENILIEAQPEEDEEEEPELYPDK